MQKIKKIKISAISITTLDYVECSELECQVRLYAKDGAIIQATGLISKFALALIAKRCVEGLTAIEREEIRQQKESRKLIDDSVAKIKTKRMINERTD